MLLGSPYTHRPQIAATRGYGDSVCVHLGRIHLLVPQSQCTHHIRSISGNKWCIGRDRKVLSPPGRGFWSGRGRGFAIWGLFCWVTRRREHPCSAKHLGASRGNVLVAVLSTRPRGHPGAPTVAVQWAWPQISLPPPCISCAGTLRGATLRFCGRADLAEKSLCDEAMLK